MPLPGSGQLSIGQIRTEIGTSVGSLGTLHSLAFGFLGPFVAISDFYGYSAVTYTLSYTSVTVGDMCSGQLADIYLGSDNVYYYTGPGGGGGYNPLISVANLWYIYQYYDIYFDAYIYEGYETNASSTTFDSIGTYFSSCSPF